MKQTRPTRLKVTEELRNSSINFRVTKSFLETFRKLAHNKQASMATLLEELVIKYMKKEGVL